MGIVENYLRQSYGATVVVKDWRLAVDVVLDDDWVALFILSVISYN
jgi:hypothetical protein